jgi:hypothetical protein
MQTDMCAFVIISRWLLRIRNISDKICTENQNTFNVQFSHLTPPHPTPRKSFC